jgi:hypothetical protein
MSLSVHPLHKTEKSSVALVDKWLADLYSKVLTLEGRISTLETANTEQANIIKDLKKKT